MNFPFRSLIPGVFVLHSILCFHTVEAQMVDGKNIPEFGKVFEVDLHQKNLRVQAYLVESSVPANILTPLDSLTLTVQFHNTESTAYSGRVKAALIQYGTKGRPGDVWVPEMFVINTFPPDTFSISVSPNGYVNATIRPKVPAVFGAYGLVVEVEGVGRQFITSLVRTFSFPSQRIQYPSFCLDDDSNEVLQRLGVHAVRHGIDYKPTTDSDYEAWFEKERERMQAYQDAGITVLVKMSAPEAYGDFQPLGIPRPWLDENGVMQNTKTDMAWMPAWDNDFKKMVYRLASEFGWPKGPVNAFALWNEPWEGISISGWGADMVRYREIYTKMAEAVEQARKDAGVDVLVGGCSSTSNALDKLFADGSDDFLDRFDFCSIHYQGLNSNANIKKWVDRKSERGRVKIWDTESWVANVDDRVAAVVACNRAAGYDRAMGVYFGNIAHKVSQPFLKENELRHTELIYAWSVAASVGAVQHFIGERKFKELLFKNGLPWVIVFEGLQSPDDGTLVVVGDIGEEFGASHVLFRNARGLVELEHEEKLRKQISSLNPEKDARAIDSLTKEINRYESLVGASLSFSDQGGKFSLHDFYGNVIESTQGTIHIPLDGRGFFLRANGQKGSFQELIDQVKLARIEGIEPLEIVASDFLSPISEDATLRLKLTNVLNRCISGRLKVSIANLELQNEQSTLNFKPHETKTVTLKVVNGVESKDNLYRTVISFDAGNDGVARQEEDLRVNVIAKRTIRVDGNLDDWTGALPQVVREESGRGVSMMEAAWYPFKNFDNTSVQGMAAGYLAYDDEYFYFASKIADPTHDPGMQRFETRNDDDFFYPDSVWIPYDGFHFGGAMKHDGISFSVRWHGDLKPTASGYYKLSINTEQSVRVWIDNELIIDNSKVRTGAVKLQRGRRYKLRVDYNKGVGSGSVQLLWESERQHKQVISSRYFPQGIEASYYSGPNFNVLQTRRTDPQIDFSWKDDEVPDPSFQAIPLLKLQWPKDVRRYSYRKDPDLPFGNFQDHDNVQIAFNVLDDVEKELYPFPPGTMKGFTNYQCTDYEYALNSVAKQYGGGSEIWRCKVPGMPHKHFFPRQNKSPLDGPVNDGKLNITHVDNTRIVEAAIPWREIPAVKKRLEQGKPIKFSFRVNNNVNNGCMELARERSVSKINGAFKVDWKEHWANEVEFAFEKR